MKMCSAFAGLGHDVHLVVPSAMPLPAVDRNDLFRRYGLKNSFNLHTVPVDPGQKKKKRVAAIKMVGLAKELSPDFIYGRNLAAALIAASEGIPLFHELHHLPRAENESITFLEHLGHTIQILRPSGYKKSEFKELYRIGALGGPSVLFRRLLTHPNLLCVIAITHALKEALYRKYPQLHGRVAVAPDGADPVPKTLPPARLRKRSADLEVGYTGHLYPGKGMEIIPHVAEMCPWANFHIVGGREEHVEHWRNVLRSHENVFLYGAVPAQEVPAYIKALDVCLLPNQPQLHVYSRRGRKGTDIAPFTSPLKMFEYMAAKKPIIASDLDVLKEVLSHGKNALLCKHDDPRAWHAALERLRQDQHLRDTLGKHALTDFEGKYEWHSRAGYILEKFESLHI